MKGSLVIVYKKTFRNRHSLEFHTQNFPSNIVLYCTVYAHVLYYVYLLSAIRYILPHQPSTINNDEILTKTAITEIAFSVH